jgi:hypothetical protein
MIYYYLASTCLNYTDTRACGLSSMMAELDLSSLSLEIYITTRPNLLSSSTLKLN